MTPPRPRVLAAVTRLLNEAESLDAAAVFRALEVLADEVDKLNARLDAAERKAKR